MAEAPACPGCETTGKRVGAITLRSLLTVDAIGRAGDAEGYRHCAARGCNVAYFHPGAGITLDKSDVIVPIGTKETEGFRPVCYCFGHSWESIEDELLSTGATTVVDAITARCRAGEDRCEKTNPQGTCCLGNVRRAVRGVEQTLGGRANAASSRDGVEAETQVPDCCATTTKHDESSSSAASGASSEVTVARPRGSAFAATGAVIAAVLSSACCWLPLALVGIGAGSSTAAAFFEAYRVWFLGGTTVLLGAAFYLAYFRRGTCGPGTACEAPRPAVSRLNRSLLWVAAIAVAGFAFFPTYVGSLADAVEREPLTAPPQAKAAATVERVFLIEGMTCEGCGVGLKKALTSVPGVLSAEVSYEKKSARVVMDATRIDERAVTVAIEDLGYRSVDAQE